MPFLFAVATIPHTSGDPKDVFQNTFSFSNPIMDEVTMANFVATAVTGFYNAGGGAMGDPTPLASQIGVSASRAANACTLKVYDVTGLLDGSPHGSPIASYAWTLAAAGELTSMPEEVAAALTIRGVGWENQPVELPDDADPDTGVERIRQRYTGKVYLGPLISAAVVRDGAGRSLLSSEVRGRLGGASINMQAGLALNGIAWCVWSREAGLMIPVDVVQVDNAPDTQRRRGVRSTSRTTYDVTP